MSCDGDRFASVCKVVDGDAFSCCAPLVGCFSHCSPMVCENFLSSEKVPGPGSPNMTVWPSGLRRWLKAPFRKGVGSNPTAVIFGALPCPVFENKEGPRCSHDNDHDTATTTSTLQPRRRAWYNHENEHDATTKTTTIMARQRARYKNEIDHDATPTTSTIQPRQRVRCNPDNEHDHDATPTTSTMQPRQRARCNPDNEHDATTLPSTIPSRQRTRYSHENYHDATPTTSTMQPRQRV